MKLRPMTHLKDMLFPSQVETASLDIAPDQQNVNYQTAINGPFWNPFDQKNPNDIFSIQLSGQEIDFSNNFEVDANSPTSSQETAPSFDEFNFSDVVETNPRFPKDCSPLPPPQTSQPPPHHTQLSRHHTQQHQKLPGPPNLPPLPLHIQKNRDLKRHERVHFPEQRTFHCWQPGVGGRAGRGYIGGIS